MATVENWLVRYPLFRDALRHGVMPFGSLPLQARTVVANRLAAKGLAGHAAQWRVSDVCVAFVELPMDLVDNAVRDHLPAFGGDTESGDEAALSVVIGETRTRYPFVARPPCLLMPGPGVFLDGWMRFLVYRTRGDITVPLLAVDWLDLYARLSRVLDGEHNAGDETQYSNHDAPC
jgi:hypothetical protein